VRTAFFSALLDAARTDDRICLVVGDLGFSVVERFADEFPARFVNAGVAEQNMMAIAAGLALSGKVVFTYSILNFTVFRCLEQIRNDICYHNLDVKICGVGAGFAYGPLGFSHHAVEDVAVMRALPNMVVIAPGDPVEASHATKAMAAAKGPCYLRLGRSGEDAVHAPDVPFQIGRAITVRPGSDITLIAAGSIVAAARRAADRLADAGMSVRLLSMHTLKPIDVGAIHRAATETQGIVTIEEHAETGGLRSAVSEVIAGMMPPPSVVVQHVTIPSATASVAGSQEYLREVHGLSDAGILRAITRALPYIRRQASSLMRR
jgi:transketolase